MLNHDYLAQSLRRPLPTKDGGTLRTVADAANYIVALPEDRRRTHWDRTVQLLLDMADPAEISRQLELALFYDRQLNLRMRTST
jgi:flagellar biosynthesis regulator FlaF